MNQLSRYPFGILIILTAFAPWLPTSYFYWRDASEFILGATYLDIIHPPGFPTYSHLGNLFTFLPFGPLTWRVQLFGTALTLLLIFICYRTATELLSLSKEDYLQNYYIFLLSFAFCLLGLLGSPSVLRQSITGEAYLLQAVFSSLLFLLAIYYEKSNDVRWILTASFVAAIGLGNHPALLLYVLPLFMLYGPSAWKTSRSSFIITLLVAAIGMMIYLSLPIRATQSPPLNTGFTATPQRLWSFVTDERDRTLRPEAITTVGRVNEFDLKTQIDITSAEAEKITREVGWYLPALALLGLLYIVLLKRYRLAITAGLLLTTPLFFFRGWQPDTFMTTFFGMLSLGSFGLINVFLKNRGHLVRLSLALLLPIMCIAQWYQNTPSMRAILSHKDAQLTTTGLLEKLPNNSLLLTESSWFSATALQNIEGIRTDLSIGYLPQMLFQRYFKPFKFSTNGNYFCSHTETLDTFTVPHLKNLGGLFSIAIPATRVLIEPALVVNQMIKQIGKARSDGLVELSNDPTVIDTESFSQKILADGARAEELIGTYLQADAASHTEARAISLADYYFQRGDRETAIAGLTTLCMKPELRICSEQSYITLARYMAANNSPLEAKKLALSVMEARGESPGMKSLLRDIETLINLQEE